MLEEKEGEMPPKREETFGELTVEEELLITGSSESFKRLEQKYGNQKDNYRKLVEKLMRRCGILCKERMDREQQKYLKRKTIPDFRRQVVKKDPKTTYHMNKMWKDPPIRGDRKD